MVDKEYVQSFFNFSHVFNSSRIAELEKNPLFSMAKLGDLLKLARGVAHPYYEGGMPVGKKQIPDDIYNLLSVPNLGVQVWFSGNDSSFGSKREHAFELRLISEEVPLIIILYGAVSGVLEVIVSGFHTYKCSVPNGFSIAEFASILNKGVLKDFVLQNCSHLNESQRHHIIEHGLC